MYSDSVHYNMLSLRSGGGSNDDTDTIGLNIVGTLASDRNSVEVVSTSHKSLFSASFFSWMCVVVNNPASLASLRFNVEDQHLGGRILPQLASSSTSPRNWTTNETASATNLRFGTFTPVPTPPPRLDSQKLEPRHPDVGQTSSTQSQSPMAMSVGYNECHSDSDDVLSADQEPTSDDDFCLSPICPSCARVVFTEDESAPSGTIDAPYFICINQWDDDEYGCRV